MKGTAVVPAGEVPGPVETTDRKGVTGAWVSQNMGMLALSPWRQEEVLAMVAVDGREPVAGRGMRGVAVGWIGGGRRSVPSYAPITPVHACGRPSVLAEPVRQFE